MRSANALFKAVEGGQRSPALVSFFTSLDRSLRSPGAAESSKLARRQLNFLPDHRRARKVMRKFHAVDQVQGADQKETNLVKLVFGMMGQEVPKGLKELGLKQDGFDYAQHRPLIGQVLANQVLTLLDNLPKRKFAIDTIRRIGFPAIPVLRAAVTKSQSPRQGKEAIIENLFFELVDRAAVCLRTSDNEQERRIAIAALTAAGVNSVKPLLSEMVKLKNQQLKQRVPYLDGDNYAALHEALLRCGKATIKEIQHYMLFHFDEMDYLMQDAVVNLFVDLREYGVDALFDTLRFSESINAKKTAVDTLSTIYRSMDGDQALERKIALGALRVMFEDDKYHQEAATSPALIRAQPDPDRAPAFAFAALPATPVKKLASHLVDQGMSHCAKPLARAWAKGNPAQKAMIKTLLSLNSYESSPQLFDILIDARDLASSRFAYKMLLEMGAESVHALVKAYQNYEPDDPETGIILDLMSEIGLDAGYGLLDLIELGYDNPSDHRIAQTFNDILSAHLNFENQIGFASLEDTADSLLALLKKDDIDPNHGFLAAQAFATMVDRNPARYETQLLELDRLDEAERTYAMLAMRYIEANIEQAVEEADDRTGIFDLFKD